MFAYVQTICVHCTVVQKKFTCPLFYTQHLGLPGTYHMPVTACDLFTQIKLNLLHQINFSSLYCQT